MKRLTPEELTQRYTVTNIMLVTKTINKHEAYKRYTLIMDKIKSNLEDSHPLYKQVLESLITLNKEGIY